MYHYYYEDTHMNHDCMNCSRSYTTDEDDNLYCPLHGTEPIDDDYWCEDWK